MSQANAGSIDFFYSEPAVELPASVWRACVVGLTQTHSQLHVHTSRGNISTVSLYPSNAQYVIADALVDNTIDRKRIVAFFAVKGDIPATAFPSEMLSHVTGPDHLQVTVGSLAACKTGSPKEFGQESIEPNDIPNDYVQ